MKRSTAEIINEQSFADVSQIGGVSYDGQQVWIAVGGRLDAIDPASGRRLRSLAVTAHAGTAFDGKHLFQIAEKCLQKIDPETGEEIGRAAWRERVGKYVSISVGA